MARIRRIVKLESVWILVQTECKWCAATGLSSQRLTFIYRTIFAFLRNWKPLRVPSPPSSLVHSLSEVPPSKNKVNNVLQIHFLLFNSVHIPQSLKMIDDKRSFFFFPKVPSNIYLLPGQQLKTQLGNRSDLWHRIHKLLSENFHKTTYKCSYSNQHRSMFRVQDIFFSIFNLLLSTILWIHLWWLKHNAKNSKVWSPTVNMYSLWSETFVG